VFGHPFSSAPPAFEDWVEQLLRSPVARERARAATLLVSMGRRDAVELLASALSDLDVDVLYSAASALAAIGSRAAVDCLLRASQDTRVATPRRVAVVLALGSARVAWPRMVRQLERLATSEDRWLRATAEESLALVEARSPGRGRRT
jgi:HEAT repeat protein